MKRVCSFCQSHYKENEKRSFYSFPKNEIIREKWIKATGITNISKHTLICSDHFDKSAFYHYNPESNGNRLKPNAVPFQFDSDSKQNSTNNYKRCCIENCQTIDSPTCTLSFYKVPISKEQLENWKRAITTPIDKDDYVCERHFTSDDLILSNNMILNSAGTYKQVKVLKRNSIPSIFDNYADGVVCTSSSNHQNLASSNHQNPASSNHQNPAPFNHQNPAPYQDVSDQFSELESDYMSEENDIDMNFDNLSKKMSHTNHIIENEEKECSNGNNDDILDQFSEVESDYFVDESYDYDNEEVDKKEIIEKVVCKQDKLKENVPKKPNNTLIINATEIKKEECVTYDASETPFNVVYKQTESKIFSNYKKLIQLPNTEWSFSFFEKPLKVLMVQQIKLADNNDLKSRIINVKQVIVRENLSLEIYILDKFYNHNEKFPVDIYDLNCLIERVDDLVICSGGAEYCKYKNLNVKYFYKDCINKWRHNLCDLVVEDRKVCNYCDKLKKSINFLNEKYEEESTNKTKNNDLSSFKKRKILQNYET